MSDRNGNDASYYARLDRLWDELARAPRPVSCATLAATLGMSTDEVRGKLMSLRSRGRATFDSRTRRWYAERVQ